MSDVLQVKVGRIEAVCLFYTLKKIVSSFLESVSSLVG